ncbi:MAG: HAD-IA family hydrolase [Blastochloris sp.]|nr:HAD-IA family hydrolase [Blastochloris sp.]
MPIKAIIFDFDGLLLDTETPDFEIMSALYREYGLELQHDRWLLGLGTHGGVDLYADLAALTGRELDLNALRRSSHELYLERCRQQPLQPGVTALLDTLREVGMPIAVASSSNREWVDGWLLQHAIRYRFVCVRTRDDVDRVKPAPDLFLSAADCLNISPTDCVVFEDSPNGIRAAAAAGMRCVAVPIRLNAALTLPPTTLRLRSIDELPPTELLARLDGSARQGDTMTR